LLFKHPEIFPLSKKCGYSVDNCSINDQQVNDSNLTVAGLVELYALRNDIFLSDFANAFVALTSLGVPEPLRIFDETATSITTTSDNSTFLLVGILIGVLAVVFMFIFPRCLVLFRHGEAPYKNPVEMDNFNL
jgi:hypothetical protein